MKPSDLVITVLDAEEVRNYNGPGNGHSADGLRYYFRVARLPAQPLHDETRVYVSHKDRLIGYHLLDAVALIYDWSAYPLRAGLNPFPQGYYIIRKGDTWTPAKEPHQEWTGFAGFRYCERGTP